MLDDIMVIVNEVIDEVEKVLYVFFELMFDYVYVKQGGIFMFVMFYIDSINAVMKEEMERDLCVFVFGEDVGRKGGVFKVMVGFYEQFGEEWVMDMLFVELVIVGVGIGVVMYGMCLIVEM